ncbi:uncharacterized protein ACBT57_003753 [Dama dama]|uniref:lysine-specific demethylase 6B-like n=1 Tax=Dama dama TaxID=30532 RepID=UPI002A371AF9|nr:lysine-specific demethylase 6B-like [Dama dama]
MTLAHPSRLPHRSRPSGLSAPETTPGPTPYAPTPCQPSLLPGPQLVLDRAPHRSQCGERAGQCVESRGHGSRSPHIRTAAWSGPGRPGRAAPPPASAKPSLGLQSSCSHPTPTAPRRDALGSLWEARPCTVSGLTGTIKNACVLPARAPTWGQLSRENALRHAFVGSVSTGYHVQQWNCWVTLLNPEKQQQWPQLSLRV